MKFFTAEEHLFVKAVFCFMKRNRFKQTLALEDRIMKAAEEFRAKARSLEPGEDRESLLNKARQFETRLAVVDTLWCRPALPAGSIKKP